MWAPMVHRCWPLLLLAVLLSALSSPLRASTSTDRAEATLSHETELNAKLLDLLTPCCSFITSTKSPDKDEKKRVASELLSCVNSSVATAWQRYPAEHLSLVGPTKTISILTRATPAVLSYAASSMIVLASYAIRRGYSMIPLLPDSTPLLDFEYYPKVSHILNALRSHSMYSNYLIWMDADLVPLDFDFAVEELIYDNPEVDVFISADVSSFINTGMIIFKNSLWTIRFLEKWLTFSSGSTSSFTDQMGFEAAYNYFAELSSKNDGNGKKSIPSIISKVKIFPPHVLNSEASPLTRLRSGHRVLHLAAEHDSLRAAVFGTLASRICELGTSTDVNSVGLDVGSNGDIEVRRENAFDSNNIIGNSDSQVSLRRNSIVSGLSSLSKVRFGVTRRYLQSTANDIYFRLAFKSIKNAFKLKPFKPFNMNTLYEVRQSSSKYTHTFRWPSVVATASSGESSSDIEGGSENSIRDNSTIRDRNAPLLYIRLLTSSVFSAASEMQLALIKAYDSNIKRRLSSLKSPSKALGVPIPLSHIHSPSSSRADGKNGNGDGGEGWIRLIDGYHATSLSHISNTMLNSTLERLVSSCAPADSTSTNATSCASGINLKYWISMHSLFIEKSYTHVIDSKSDMVSQNAIELSLRKECNFKGVKDSDNPQVYMRCVNDLVSSINGQFPELLKLTAELNFELLTSLYFADPVDESIYRSDAAISPDVPSSSINADNSRAAIIRNGFCVHRMNCVENLPSLARDIANYLFVILDVLEQLVAKQQTHIVLDMRASLLSLIGQFYLAEADSDLVIGRKAGQRAGSSGGLGLEFAGMGVDPLTARAIDYLLASLNIYEQGLRGSYMDNRAYVQTLSLLATAQCSSRQFVPGLKTFKKAIELEKSRLGATHFQLIEKYTNAGFCALDTRDTSLASDYFRVALDAINANPSSHLKGLETVVREKLASISSSKVDSGRNKADKSSGSERASKAH